MYQVGVATVGLARQLPAHSKATCRIKSGGIEVKVLEHPSASMRIELPFVGHINGKADRDVQQAKVGCAHRWLGGEPHRKIAESKAGGKSDPGPQNTSRKLPADTE